MAFWMTFEVSPNILSSSLANASGRSAAALVSKKKVTARHVFSPNMVDIDSATDWLTMSLNVAALMI